MRETAIRRTNMEEWGVLGGVVPGMQDIASISAWRTAVITSADAGLLMSGDATCEKSADGAKADAGGGTASPTNMEGDTAISVGSDDGDDDLGFDGDFDAEDGPDPSDENDGSLRSVDDNVSFGSSDEFNAAATADANEFNATATADANEFNAAATADANEDNNKEEEEEEEDDEVDEEEGVLDLDALGADDDAKTIVAMPWNDFRDLVRWKGAASAWIKIGIMLGKHDPRGQQSRLQMEVLKHADFMADLSNAEGDSDGIDEDDLFERAHTAISKAAIVQALSRTVVTAADLYWCLNKNWEVCFVRRPLCHFLRQMVCVPFRMTAFRSQKALNIHLLSLEANDEQDSDDLDGDDLDGDDQGGDNQGGHDEEETTTACVEYHVYVACPGFGLMV